MWGCPSSNPRGSTHFSMAAGTAASPRTLASTFRDTGIQADDGADAQQVAHDGGGSARRGRTFHLPQAVGGQTDFHAVQLLLQLAHTGGQLTAVAHLAGALAQIPAVGHRIILAVDDLDLH